MKLDRIFEEVLDETQNRDILEIAKQVIKDMRALNRLLFKKNENFSFKANNILHEMSDETDSDIQELITRIENNLNEISIAIGNTLQVIPHNKEQMDNIMIGIMTQYIFTSNSIQFDSGLGEIYSVDLNRIHTALNNLNENINRYNTEVADENNYPKILSRNEALSLAKQRLNSQN